MILRAILFIFLITGNGLLAQVFVSSNSTIGCTEDNSTATFTIASGTAPFTFHIKPGCAPLYTAVTTNTNPAFSVSCTTTFTVVDVNSFTVGIVTHGVNVPSVFTVNVLPTIDTICKGTVLNMFGDYSTLSVSSGMTYTIVGQNWSNGANTPMANTRTVTVAPGHSLYYSFFGLCINSKGRQCTVRGNKTVYVKDCNIDSSSAVLSSCSAHDSIIKKYEPDAARLAIRNLIRVNSSFIDSVKIKHDLYTRYLRALIAVYNATTIVATDTITKFPGYEVHTRPYPAHSNNYTLVKADSNLTWMKNLKNNIIPTGDVAVDDLIDRYHLQKSGYTNSNNTYSYHTVYFKTDTSINMIALEQKFLQIPGCSGGYDQYYFYDSHDIMDTTTSDPHFTEIAYQFKWGDCLMGCTGKRVWTFRVYHDCKVQYMGSWGDPFGLVGLKENKNLLSTIQVYPNPVKNKIYFETDEKQLLNSQITITNQLGQVVLKQKYKSEIDVTVLNKGMYFLTVSNDSESKTFKIIKE